MDEEVFNMSTRKFLKKLGVTAQREIELAVREQLESGDLQGDETRDGDGDGHGCRSVARRGCDRTDLPRVAEEMERPWARSSAECLTDT